MNKPYKHSQLGSVIIISMIILFGLMFLALNMVYSDGFSIMLTSIVLLILVLFYKLTIKVDDKNITIIFGVGLFRKKFPLHKIKSCNAVKNKWYHGWGIHYSPDGWVYNVSGWDAVELQFKNGSKARIGTDDAKTLNSYINKHI